MSFAGSGNTVNANIGFNAVFYQALEFETAEVDRIINALSMRMTSTKTSEEYNFSDAVPGMQEWLDERKLGRLGVQKFTLANRHYSNGIEIDSDDVDDDNLGLLIPRIRSLAEAAARHKINLIRDLLNSGFVDVGYDNVSFFNDAHPRVSTGTNDNLETGALSQTTFQNAVNTLESITDEQGEPLSTTVTHLIHGTDLQWTARNILQDSRLASGATNVTQGVAAPLLIKGLTAGSWYVADLSKSLKPLVWQDRKPVTFAAQDDPADNPRFMTNQLRYGADYRGAAGYAMWQLIVGSTG